LEDRTLPLPEEPSASPTLRPRRLNEREVICVAGVVVMVAPPRG
jgi:hypothetical protein